MILPFFFFLGIIDFTFKTHLSIKKITDITVKYIHFSVWQWLSGPPIFPSEIVGPAYDINKRKPGC